MDKYKIIRKLGQGAQSVSYLANPIDSPNEVVVLKRIATNVVRPSDVSVFLRLRHPGIVPCLAALQHEDQLVLVTPYYEGGDLEHCIEHLKKQKKPLDTSLIVKWTVQLVRALQYCHDQKVIHRDLKLSNIFLSNSNDLSKSRVYLGGFGLARALDKTMGTATTLVGSPSNLSPEVISGQPYSFSSDVWSLGCLVYELLTFEKPFSSASFAQVVMKVCNGQYDPLPTATTPKFMVSAVSGMLQVDPKQRWLLAEVVESDERFVSADKDEKIHIIAETPVRKTRSKPEENNQQQQQAAAQPKKVVASSSSSSSNNNNNNNKKPSNHSRSTSELENNGNSSFNNGGGGNNNNDIVGALANSEELEQWIQWKHREFAQIDSILKKIKANEDTIDLFAASGANSGSPTPPPPQQGLLPQQQQKHDLDPKRAQQRFGVASPRGKSNEPTSNAHGLPLAPNNNNNNNNDAIKGGRRAVNVQQQRQDKNSLFAEQQKIQQQQQKIQQQQLESAEKRQQQRADLQKRIAEGRRAQPAGNGGNNNNGNNQQQQQDIVVVATPSRALYQNNNNNNNNIHQQHAPHTPPPKQQQHDSNTPSQQQNTPSSAGGPQKGNNNNKHGSLKDEIARRRAEAKMSPRGKTDRDGQPVLEIVLPGNLKKFGK